MKLSREWLSGRLNSLLDSFLFWTVLAIGFSAVGGIALLALALIEGAPIAMSILVGLGGGLRSFGVDHLEGLRHLNRPEEGSTESVVAPAPASPHQERP